MNQNTRNPRKFWRARKTTGESQETFIVKNGNKIGEQKICGEFFNVSGVEIDQISSSNRRICGNNLFN